MMEAYEFPLVIFTVLSQWAVGIVLAVVLLEWLKPKFMNSFGKKVLKAPILASFLLSVIAALTSMFHLNNPFKSYTSLLGSSHSWLSREIITVLIFNAFLLLLTYVWWKKAESTSMRKGLGTVTAVFGILMVISSATVYFSIPLHPTWHNWTTYANFLLTGLLLGALTVVYFALKGKDEERDSSVVRILGIYLALIIFALIATIGAFALISSGAEESQFAATISFTSILFWIRIFGSLLIPTSLVIIFMFGKKMISLNYVLAATFLVLLGEVSGRMIFYSSVMSQYPWF